MKKILFIASPLVVLGIAFAWPHISPISTESELENAFTKLRGGDYDKEYQYRSLPGGEYFTFIVQHSCCSGNGRFDAVAIRTSLGVEYSSTNNYCGYEGFHSEIAGKPRNLDELDKILLQNGFTKLNTEQAR
jgi:hypothetical protein